MEDKEKKDQLLKPELNVIKAVDERDRLKLKSLLLIQPLAAPENLVKNRCSG